MKTALAIILMLLMSCAAAFAHPPRLYVGGSMQWNAIGENERLWPGDDTPPALITYTGMGMQFESGIAANVWTAYLGYRQDWSGHREHGLLYHEDNRWRGERFLFGARIHVSDDYANPVKPLFGAALTYGWGQRRWESQSGMMAGEVAEEGAGGSFGWLGEAGFLVRLPHRVSLSLTGRLETLNLKFGDQTRRGSITNVSQGALQLGVMYEFERGLWR